MSGIVLYLSAIGHVGAVRLDIEPHGVYQDAVGIQFVDGHVAVDSRQGRRSKVDISVAERDALPLQHLHDEVVVAGGHVHGGHGQRTPQGCQVYPALLQVALYLTHHPVGLVHQLLVASAGIGVQMEVAAIDHGMGGVAAHHHVERHVVGPVNT